MALRQAEDEKIAEAYAQAQAALDKLDKVKDSDFQALSSDFWKPEEEGDELKGIFVGVDTSARLHQYIFAVVNDGEKMMVRMNGGHQLKKVFGTGRVAPGTVCRIVFNGQKKTEGGRKMNDYTVAIAR